MTNTYAHLGPSSWPVTSPEAMKLQWSHSVISERNYLNEWQAQENASTLAAEMGSSALLRVDTISFPFRRRSSKLRQVCFDDEITVLIGEDCGCDLRPVSILHQTLHDFDEKPWSLRSQRPTGFEEDVTSFMARRPSQPARPLSCTSSTSSSSSSSSMSPSPPLVRSLDWRQTVLVLLDGRMLPVRLPWNDGEQLVRRICATISSESSRGIYGAHQVRHRPADLVQQDLQCLLVQTDTEPRPSTFLRLVLIDLEIFEPNEVLPGAFRRFSKWIPETLNRVSAFRLLGLESLLAAHPDRSHLWHNNVLVDDRQVSPMRFNDGDFLHVLIGDSVDGFACSSPSSTSFQENATEDEAFSGLQASTTLINLHSSMVRHADVDPLTNVAQCISSNDILTWSPMQCSANESSLPQHVSHETPRNDFDGNPFEYPPRVEQPVWHHELWDLLREHGEPELHEEGPIMYVTSHYISHANVQRNEVTRPLRFDVVRFMWEDYIDNAAPLEIYIVNPALPNTVYQGTVATVVVTQHPRPDRAACVMSVAIAGHSHLQNTQIAHSAPLTATSDELLGASGARPQCLPVQTILPPCQFWIGDQPLPLGADVRVYNGLGLQIVIPEERATETHAATAAGGLPTTTEVENDDELALFQTTPQVWLPPRSTPADSVVCSSPRPMTCGLNIPSRTDETTFYQQTSTTIAQPVLQWDPTMIDHFIEDLAGLWELLAFAWEDEPRSGTVLVWFVDHQWPEPHCLAPRPVRLYPAIAEWRRLIWQAWEDEIVPGAVLDYHLVIPKPPTVDSQIIAHVLLVQRPHPPWATMIISIFDARAPDFDVRQFALTLPAQFDLDDLLRVLGVHRECTTTPPLMGCTAWHREVTLQRGVPFHAHSGISILMRWFEPPPIQPPEVEDDETAHLQLHTKRKLVLDDLIPDDSRVLVDFTAAAQAFYSLMSLPFDFLLDWPDDLELPDETTAALGTLRSYDDGSPVSAFHFYVDGSKVAGYGVGAATVCLVECEGDLALAGVLPVHVASAEHAYIGEHAAMVNALIWAVQLSTWHLQKFPMMTVAFHFCFDATNTGYQAAGWWRAHEYKEWQTLFRSLAHILEHRHDAKQLTWNHVRAHAQHPWNELVDRVAKFASKNPQLVGTCDHWIPWLSDSSMMNALQWIWYLEVMRSGAPEVAPLHGLLLAHPLRVPAASPDVSLAPSTSTCEAYKFQIDMKIATANVLTLSIDPTASTTSITRQATLMRQFHEAGCHVVGLQETRHRHLQDTANPYYHMVGAPATSQGCDGVQLWISKTLPIYEDGPVILSKDIRIVAAHATYLIVKVSTTIWRCIFITARAPHSGHGVQAIDSFWHTISTHIRQQMNEWPMIFLGDTNGHLGDTMTDAVGNLHGRQENASGTAFHQWMLEHQMFAPATFQQHHTGTLDYTYVTPDGDHCTRIDYIALPRALTFESVSTWVDEIIDITTQRVDHLPVLCHFVLHVFRPAEPVAAKSLPGVLGSDSSFCRALLHPANFHALRDGIAMPSWDVDPHCTADILAIQTQKAVRSLQPRSIRRPRKSHLSEPTWQLICHKKLLFKQLRALRRTRTFKFFKPFLKPGDDLLLMLRSTDGSSSTTRLLPKQYISSISLLNRSLRQCEQKMLITISSLPTELLAPTRLRA